MSDSEAADSLRKILAKSTPKAPKPKSSQPLGTTTAPPAATTPATPLQTRHAAPTFHFPTVNVPGSSPKSATGSASSGPRKSVFSSKTTSSAPKPNQSSRKKEQAAAPETTTSSSTVSLHSIIDTEQDVAPKEEKADKKTSMAGSRWWTRGGG
ncbi:hypothetical protein PtrSN002B_008883 [Pyrenophora tritici-repentis]|uniref:Uncharacterized protein n=2 Tax=Pyrenophora tritici-repentis TaxID=45151 RepID=A0A2W1G978_9PLEO|nr:uncharacterized protein PTRG_08188 [Pyrenophora tritici-repentis Pt-1C-BFP]KAA8615879.1 hypothetical protein PtrV1_11275 [Pyrenophora tritici-repentis]EDU51107.1 predicted protein [Pyrenophora tritici-repentis Pt-1C-BFP]KAF7443526.1 hypothetical protein A1F99_116000 [Pyrenophora tritici-repentis]KAF7566759.1 hypothetical protein PtrM4_150790 [Pyrenophora tritici-repentis]KAG9379264.1 hypothetical protein A1F94_009620 [Pyrenophora tritici-repentis]